MSSRRLWTVGETRALLTCYAARKNEFQHSRKKKFAYQNVVEDLTSMGVLKDPVSALMVENKIKYLLKAYKQAVDNNNSTRNCPSIEPYSDLMEEIFGDGVLTRDTGHVLNVGSQQTSIEPLPTSEEKENRVDDEPEEIYTDFQVLYEELPEGSYQNRICTIPSSSSKQKRPMQSNNFVRSPLNEISAPSKRQKKKSGAKKVTEIKIEWEREKEAAKRKRHEEKIKFKEEAENNKNSRHKERIEMQKQLLAELRMRNNINNI